MKKYIVLSVNDNVDYLYFTPLTCWAWRQFGWEPILFYKDSDKNIIDLERLVWDAAKNPITHLLADQEGYRSDTITQISRLYGACIQDDGVDWNGHRYGRCYMMTGDIDMLPLSDYWKPMSDQPTVWGHDLTGFGHYPICYIGMTASAWRLVMKMYEHRSGFGYDEMIKRDLDTLPQAKDPDFYKYWFSDQDLITARLNEYGKEKITFINRGKNPKHTDYAFGRVDRGAWSLDHAQLIDAHLEQQTHHNPDKIRRLFELLRHVWPQEDFTWFEDYTDEFKKLAV